jgi:hypothetical protein
MTYAVRGLGLAVSLSLVSTVALVPRANAQSTTAAHVYIQIQGPAGAVYGYSASSSGQLTAISGAPWKPTGQIIGSNKTQFITLGQDNIHSYAVASDGAIGSQLEQNPFTDYPGGNCGTGSTAMNSAVLDHTGEYVYILLQTSNGSSGCSAYQSFNINSAGAFDGLGDGGMIGFGNLTLPSILGNETFAYADDKNGPIGFQRLSSGELAEMPYGFQETDPTLSGGSYTPGFPDASPTGNYVVLHLFPNDANPFQLGSYTVDSQGNLSTTNTSTNMPTSALIGPSSTFSPDGTMFVLYAGGQGSGTLGNGIEIYNFNAASPLTLNTTLLNGTPISQVAWDTSNHLYAISQSANKLWVYNVTRSSMAESATLSIGSPFSMVVASQAASGGGSCPAPTNNGVNVCSPGEGTTVTSPVQINAATTVSGGVYRFELWSGSTKLLSVDNGIMDQSLSLAPGSYHLTFDARSSSGNHEYATRDITVQ